MNFHSNHCRICKQRVFELLRTLYGDCRTGHQFPWPAHPEAYENTAIGAVLGRIRIALGDPRGHRDFIKAAQMPPCDYFVVDPPFIVEFDENQHFSRPRLVTLSSYPANLNLGYSISHWRDLCRQIGAVDELPFDRDERRAWYDTLRDLVPAIHGFKPTARLYAGEFEGCGLDVTNPADLAAFRRLLRAPL